MSVASVRYENKGITAQFLHQDTAPPFDSLFTFTHVDHDNIVKYPISCSILNIAANTRLPNSELVLRNHLAVLQDMTPDGYILRSYYIDEESFGQTLEEAYFDLLTSIRDRYCSLVRREMRLSSRDKMVLDHIRSLLD